MFDIVLKRVTSIISNKIKAMHFIILCIKLVHMIVRLKFKNKIFNVKWKKIETFAKTKTLHKW